MIEDYYGYKTGVEKIPFLVRHRPKTFDEFIGNDSVIQNLKSILSKEATHTFLITARIGCGKTSLARIIAAELGCNENGCSLFEVNSADANGIDYMRALRFKNSFADRLTFIFDEAHKISEPAQNAALKIFEEAPSNHFYIICTDKPDKIIPALRSRCLDFELSPLLDRDMSKLLRRVCQSEGWELTDEILNRVVKVSEGVPREALKQLLKVYSDPDLYITENDSTRIFVLQNKQDLAFFRLITKNMIGYESVSISSANIEKFANKDVVIIQHKSDTGRKSTETFLRKVSNIAKTIKTIEIPGEQNITFEDWANTQPHNVTVTTLIKNFEEIIENPQELRFPSLRTAPDDLIISFDTFNRLNLPKRKKLMQPWLEEGSLILLASPPGVGKSFFAMEIVAACSEGREAMSGLWQVEKSLPVLYIDGEMHWEDIYERGKALGLAKSLLLSKIYYEHKNGKPLLNLADDPGIRNPLTSYIVERGIKLLILDNIYSLVIGMDHNFETAWSPINQWLISLRNMGVAVIIVHHTGKSGDQLGTSARKFNIDYSFMLEKKPSSEDRFGNCSFSVIIDKERRPVKNMRKKVFTFSEGKWNVRDFTKIENKKAEIKLRQIATMIVDGKITKEIAEHFDCSSANISQQKRKLLEKGIIQEIEGLDANSYEFSEFGENWVNQKV